MSTFKRGDRVKCTMSGEPCNGLIGTVINDAETIVCVEFDELFRGGHDGNGYGKGKNNHCYNLKHHYIKLVMEEEEHKPSPKKGGKSTKKIVNKFKVGDRVKYTGTSKTKANGKIGTVKLANEPNCYNVEFDDYIDGHTCGTGIGTKDGHGWHCSEDELESYIWTFKKGDWVFDEEAKITSLILQADNDETCKLDDNRWVENDEIRPATEEEIERRLINDAELKGLKIGVKARVIGTVSECTIIGYKYKKSSAMIKGDGIILLDHRSLPYNLEDIELVPVKKSKDKPTPPAKMNFEEGDEVICVRYSSSILSCPYIGEVGKVIRQIEDITTVNFREGVWGFGRTSIGDLVLSSSKELKPIMVDFEITYDIDKGYQHRVIDQMKSMYGDVILVDSSLLLLL